MNDYYSFTETVSPGTLVDAFPYNREMMKISAAFDVVPPASQLSSGTLSFSLDTGTVNAFKATVVQIPEGPYDKGNNVALKVGDTTTGPSTLDVNEKGIIPVRMAVVGATVAGDLKQDGIYTFVYDGTNFQCLEMSPRYFDIAINGQTAAAASATSASGSATSASGSATSASGSATSASGSATVASTNASAASIRATNASSAASTASSAASTASSAASTASSAASTASNRATAANNSSTASAASASSSNTSKNNAGASATGAQESAEQAQESAEQAQDIPTAPSFDDDAMAAILDLELIPGSVEFFAADEDPNVIYPGTSWSRVVADSAIRIGATGPNTTGGSDSVTLAAGNIPSHTHSATPGVMSTFDYGTKTLSTVDYGNKTLATFTDTVKWSSTFDYGSKGTGAYDYPAVTSSSAGAHTHFLVARQSGDYGTAGVAGRTAEGSSNSYATSAVGVHTHTINIPAHSHTVAIGAHNHTAVVGSHTHSVAVGSHSHSVAVGSHTHSASVTVNAFGSAAAFDVLNSNISLVAWYRTE